jgi:hypothetical protein
MATDGIGARSEQIRPWLNKPGGGWLSLVRRMRVDPPSPGIGATRLQVWSHLPHPPPPASGGGGVYNLRGLPRVAAACCRAGRLTLGYKCVAPVGGFGFGAGLPRPAKGKLGMES